MKLDDYLLESWELPDEAHEIARWIEKENRAGIDERMKNRLWEAEFHYRKACSAAVRRAEILRSAGYNPGLFISDFCTNMGDIRRIAATEESIDEAVSLFTEAIATAGEDPQRKAKALEFRSILHQQYTEEYTKALLDATEALNLYHDAGDGAKAARLRCLRAEPLSLLDIDRNYGEARRECWRAIIFYRKMQKGREMAKEKKIDVKLFHDLGDAFHTLGRVYSRKGRHSDAIGAYMRSLGSLAQGGKRSEGATGVVHARAAYEYMKIGNFQRVEYHHSKFEEVRENQPCPIQKIVLEILEPQIEEIKEYLAGKKTWKVFLISHCLKQPYCLISQSKHKSS